MSIYSSIHSLYSISVIFVWDVCDVLCWRPVFNAALMCWKCLGNALEHLCTCVLHQQALHKCPHSLIYLETFITIWLYSLWLEKYPIIIYEIMSYLFHLQETLISFILFFFLLLWLSLNQIHFQINLSSHRLSDFNLMDWLRMTDQGRREVIGVRVSGTDDSTLNPWSNLLLCLSLMCIGATGRLLSVLLLPCAAALDAVGFHTFPAAPKLCLPTEKEMGRTKSQTAQAQSSWSGQQNRWKVFLNKDTKLVLECYLKLVNALVFMPLLLLILAQCFCCACWIVL